MGVLVTETNTKRKARRRPEVKCRSRCRRKTKNKKAKTGTGAIKGQIPLSKPAISQKVFHQQPKPNLKYNNKHKVKQHQNSDTKTGNRESHQNRHLGTTSNELLRLKHVLRIELHSQLLMWSKHLFDCSVRMITL